MALWVCVGCSTAYSVGAPACPHCGLSDYYDEGQEPVGKITVHGGASHAEDIPAPAPEAPAEAPAPAPVEAEAETPAEPETPVEAPAPAKPAARKTAGK